jgi:nucleotide-binding universal stress UspA family protein
MTESSATRPFAILTCFDDSPESGYAFEEAARLAKRIPGSEIHLIDVRPGEPSVQRTRQLAGQLTAYVNEKALTIGGLEGRRVAIHVRGGQPVREIAQLAAEVDIDVIVMGSPGHPHLKNLLPGSLAEGLLKHAPCPVIVVGARPTESPVHVPAIEPPCPQCVQTRAASHGAQWWCPRHTSNGAYGTPGHVYSYQSEIPFGSHDSTVSPTGIDF